jgi:hypothetical protein
LQGQHLKRPIGHKTNNMSKKVEFKRLKTGGDTYTIVQEKGEEIKVHGYRFFVTKEKATRGFVDVKAFEASTGYLAASLYMRMRLSIAVSCMQIKLQSERTKEQCDTAILRMANYLKDLGFDYPLNP